MAHFRSTLRDKAANIVTGLGITGANVFSGRSAPLRENEMPGLVIVPSEETSSAGTSGSVTVDRYLDLLVFGECMGADGLFDVLDDISAEVETALFHPSRANLDGAAIDVELRATSFKVGDNNGQSEKRRGQMQMRFRIYYRTPQTNPTINI